MLRTKLLAATFAAIGTSTAQLAADLPATTGQHLLEVNDQWTTMDPSALDGMHAVRFNSDAERIAEHLHRVRQHLADNAPENISHLARSHRSALLDALETYADRGVFPMNNGVAGRSPVFIDEFGNACAVGHLMITSGDAELAERISQEMNLAYVHDIALPEVAEWATTNGFTIDELAWIQPTYDHMKHRDESLIASFQMANGDRLEVRRPASPNAAQKLRLLRKGSMGDKVLATLPMLSGVQVMEYNGHVYIAGMPPNTGSSAELYEWNGTSLVAHDPYPGRMAIGSLSVVNGTLHVLGYEQGEGEPHERYLAENGEWKTVEHAAAPLPGAIVPEQRLP
ncbi:MAG: hypothetical protein JNM62_09910 [Flavobacteriales bacterium]|nr:hypothetical protein [Flavobacteriales bacterium]